MTARGPVALVGIVACGLAFLGSATAPAAQNAAPTSEATAVGQESESAPATPTGPGAAPGRTIRPLDQAIAQGTPFKVGSFLLYPEFLATWMYDSNVFFSNAEPISDHAMIYSPAVWLQSNWTRHAVNLYASADLTRYFNRTSENTNDWRVSAEGRYDIDNDTNFYGGVRHAREHEDREDPSSRNGLEPTRYTLNRYYAGFFRQQGKLSVRVGGTAQHLDYRDVPFESGSGAINFINNDDRDRWQYTGGVRVGYELSPRLEPYVQLAVDNRRYDNFPDDLLQLPDGIRDSNGKRALVGLRWNVPKVAKLDAFAGYLAQDYADSRLTDVSAPLFGASVIWAATPKTTVTGYLDRTVEETTVFQSIGSAIVPASSYLNTYVAGTVDHRLTDKLVLQFNGSVSRVDYRGIDRLDNYYGGGAGLVYRVTRNFYVDVSYAYRNLHSSIPGENFIKRQLFVRLAFPLSN